MDQRKRINPDRIPCDYVLVYALCEGGEFQFRADWTPEKFDNLLSDGYFFSQGGFDGEEVVYPSYAMLCKVERGHDFRIDEINGDRTPFQRNEERRKIFQNKR